MFKIYRMVLLLSVALLSFPLGACQKKESPPTAKQGQVSATPAYEKYFGHPPTTDKGSCYAFVIYFPSARERGKVVPFPFFTFDEGTIKKVALERFLSGMEVGSYKGEISRPFAAGTRILSMTEQGGGVVVDFSRELLNAEGDGSLATAAFNAMALTLVQFHGVKDVHLEVDGKFSGVIDGKDIGKFLGGAAGQPLTPDETAVMQPSSPRLLSVTAMKEKGSTMVEEVNAFFDRPVEIKAFSFAGKDGKILAGDVYQSVFDMAAVLKPKNPGLFNAGMPVKVRWKVTDKLGRVSEGESVFTLEVKEH